MDGGSDDGERKHIVLVICSNIKQLINIGKKNTTNKNQNAFFILIGRYLKLFIAMLEIESDDLAPVTSFDI